MDEQLIGKSIYHPGGPLTDQNQLLGRTSLYKEDGTPLNILSAEDASAKFQAVINVVGYGAKGDGTTNDSVAIQTAIDACASSGGGHVFFPAGVYRCNVIVKPKVVLVGVGQNTELKSVAGSNDDVVKGVNFSTLTNKNYAAGDNLLGCYGFGLRDLQINGDKASQSSGWGVRVWGSKLNFRDIVVYNCKSGGIWTEFTTHDAGAFVDLLEPIFDGIKTQGNDGDGWRFRGPHDARINNFVTVSNTGYGFKSESVSGSYRGALYGYNWNSWLNANSFYFSDGSMLYNAAATGGGVGIGVEYKAGSGNHIFHGIVAGHPTGMLLRGSKFNVNVTIYSATTAAIVLGSSGAGNEYAGGVIDIIGEGVGIGINCVNVSWPSLIRGRIGTLSGALKAGTGSAGDTVDLREVGGAGASTFTIPGNSIYGGGTGYTPILPKSNGTLLTWEASQTTVGVAGAASALPAAPVGYFRIADPSGNLYKVPYYNV